MAGGIFTSGLEPDERSHCSLKPLVCYQCQHQYEAPRLLDCFHTFCGRCIKLRQTDNTITCAICGKLSRLPDDVTLPPTDPLLQFLLDASAQEATPCANCDKADDVVYFCNTCSQPLCTDCRVETHRAKMFARHHIVPLSQRTVPPRQSCGLHHEPYIMYSTEDQCLLCIKCFRDMTIEARTKCLDLDSAFSLSCNQLEQTIQAMRDLQTTVHERVLLLRSLLEEVKQNSDQERINVLSLYSDMVDKITAKRNELLEEIDRQYRTKERFFTEQLGNLSGFLPIINTHLVMGDMFSTSANKFDMLGHSQVVVDRFRQVSGLHTSGAPTIGSQISTDHTAQYARSLENLLKLNLLKPYTGINSPVHCANCGDYKRSDTSSQSASITFTSDGGRKINGSNGNHKVIFIEANTTFAQHFREFEDRHRDMVQQFESVKKQVQELQRDMTQRRCLAKQSNISRIMDQATKASTDISTHLQAAETQRALLEKHWESVFQRVSNEQEIYQAQVNDILRMKQESQSLITIAKQLVPFIKSINKLTEHISPKLGDCKRGLEHEDQITAMLEQINTLEPDSQHRVDAIKHVEDDRIYQCANRVNPLDNELKKTKGLLRSPSARKDSVSRHSLEDADKKLNCKAQREKEVDSKPGTDESLQPILLEGASGDTVSPSVDVVAKQHKLAAEDGMAPSVDEVEKQRVATDEGMSSSGPSIENKDNPQDSEHSALPPVTNAPSEQTEHKSVKKKKKRSSMCSDGENGEETQRLREMLFDAIILRGEQQQKKVPKDDVDKDVKEKDLDASSS